MNNRNSYPLRVWRRLTQGFVAWHDRACLRVDPQDLTDKTLRDIGLRRGDERINRSRLFWIP
jgi:uncharacterized protein YjiS (DUF1127 family)